VRVKTAEILLWYLMRTKSIQKWKSVKKTLKKWSETLLFIKMYNFGNTDPSINAIEKETYLYLII
jgi:hypothetical protein